MLLVFALAASASFGLRAQSEQAATVQQYLNSRAQSKFHLTAADVTNWRVSDEYLSKQTGATQVYLQQTYAGVDVYNAVSTAAVKNGEVRAFANRFVADLANRVNVAPSAAQVNPQQAVLNAAAEVKVVLSNLKAIDTKAGITAMFTADNTKGEIKVKPCYQMNDEAILLAWNVEIRHASDWWNVRIDALSGAVLDKNNFTTYCNFTDNAYSHLNTGAKAPKNFFANDNIVNYGNAGLAPVYNVVAFPGESPIHQARSLEVDPANATASPYGWHDTNGATGAEYTITRGNNVYASEDRDGDDVAGYSPDGGANLNFDFPYNASQAPLTWEDAAITNLFYANNKMHDISYVHGFDEVSGNYQANNYGNGGAPDDAVDADAQDGSGTNNANFQAPQDGIPGRMQMYIWTGGGAGGTMTVNSPAGVAGTYTAFQAGFGPAIATPITQDLVLGIDGTAPTSDGCSALTNTAALTGKIALLDRGTCNFTAKVQAAETAGAIACVICNNVAGAPFAMGGTATNINIPSVMISQADCQTIKASLSAGNTVNTTLNATPTNADRDSDMDNGIIAHEYTHGISIRLTGGPSNSGCLDNVESMGEGWSDYFGLVATIRPSDTRNTPRPVGTYAYGEPTSGNGIRNQIYSTDMNVNTYTYGDLPATGGETHNVGELWTTMLWDMTWDLIDAEGFNSDLYATTGGNNVALSLVIEGMKQQPCSPGFVDGRDGILAADDLLYGGAHRCLIWNAFARRGLGFSADQGSSNSETDGTEAFDLPPACQVATVAPTAAFSADRTTACVGLATIQFTDQSTNIAQQWAWNFGDGGTSTLQNPVHTYTAAGTYTVTLVVTNTVGSDSEVQTAYITVTALPATSATGDLAICSGETTTLTANVSGGNTAQWSQNGTVVYTGNPFVTPALTTNTTYQVASAEVVPVQNVGPVDNTFGTGGNHNNTFVGQVLFTAAAPFKIVSVYVYATGTANRDISLFDGAGNILQTVTVNVPTGPSRITLNIDVPAAGDYGLGAGPNINLYRNNGGATYPYTLNGICTITGSNAGQAGFYYYFYDWEVQGTPCTGPASDVTVAVGGPTANFTSTNNNTAYTFTDQSGAGVTTWAWDFGDGSTSTLQNPSHTYSTPGTYTVTLVVSNGGTCTGTTTQTITVINGTEQLTNAFNVSLAPNPANTNTTINFVGTLRGALTLELYAADGRLVRQETYGANINTLNLPLGDLASGIYTLRLRTDDGAVVKRLVKN